MLIYSILFIILSNAVTLRRDKSILFSRVTITVLLYSVLISRESAYASYLDTGVGLYGGLFHITSTVQIFQIFIFIITAIILELTAFYPRRLWIKGYSMFTDIFFTRVDFNHGKYIGSKTEQYKIIEYPLIILFIVTGSVFLISTSDLVSIFLSIELQSYGLYLLSTIYRNSELATSAGLTYFLLGGLSSCFILLGTSLLYSNSGLTNLDGLYVVTSLNDVESEMDVIWLYNNNYISMSLLVLSVGFLFKVSAAPFHFWSPDVYDAIPTVVTTFVAIVAKIAILIFLLELVHYTSNFLLKSEFNWTNGLLISSLLSLIIGTVLGLTQFRIKRLLAYSTISHMGFILLALTINSIESIQSFIFYLIQYSLSNLNAFILLLGIGYILYYFVNNNKEYNELSDTGNSPIQLINQIKGFYYINPVLSLSFAITIFSFVGVPPLIGFFGKQMVLSAALDSGYVFISLIAILTSVVGAVYYLNIIKQMFFFMPEYTISPALLITDSKFRLLSWDYKKLIGSFSYNYSSIFLSSSLIISTSAITLIMVIFIFNPEELLNIANILSLIIFNP